MIQFSSALTIVDGLWTAFKASVISRGLSPVVQYDDDGVSYRIFAMQDPLCFTCQIWKGAVPVSNYTQAQNDADKADFEAKYLPYANRAVGDIIAPAMIIANSVKAVVGGGANMNVDGSVTPVVYEYNPPNNFDIEINALSLLFEDPTAFQFGNKFVLTGVATLANGLLLELKAGDVAVSPWQNMRRTRDIIEISAGYDITTGTTNFMRVRVQLPRALRLSRNGTFATPDYLRLTVRDNLSSFGFIEAHFQGVKR